MLYIKAGTFIYIYLTVSIARMLAASVQCWRMKNGASVDMVDVDSLSLLTRCRRMPLVLELPLWLTVGWSLTCQPRRTTRKIFASSVKRTLLWSRSQQKRLDLSKGRVRRQSTSRHDMTGSFASCYKSHRLHSRLWLLHFVVLLTRLRHVV